MVITLPKIVIKQGDSIHLFYGLKNISDLSGWSCNVQVKETLIGVVIHNETITNLSEDGSRFTHIISKNNTEDWEVGDYFLIADLWKTSTGESKELHAKIRVEQQGIPAE